MRTQKSPNGLVIRDDPGVNEGYSLLIDPESFEFADMTTEVCDGLPSDIENASLPQSIIVRVRPRLLRLKSK